jgi:hypothetical protein
MSGLDSDLEAGSGRRGSAAAVCYACYGMVGAITRIRSLGLQHEGILRALDGGMDVFLAGVQRQGGWADDR